ncbi:1231_t:CDS:2 [Ambispora gerdemannii]|uniref:1231_t:CDS:1 n=1 Tax=Ambispora gerdemannii TaxID=144530 RepID=A0A9N9CCS1_9GLOM|nr:1231_t:CDS:2 [Ambispora gerdemannii]
MSVATNALLVPQQQRFEFPKRRRRSNSSNQILAHHNFKAVRTPRRDAPTSASSNTNTKTTKRDYSIPGPPRLAYDTTTSTFTNTRMTMTPPSRPEYGIYYCGRGGIDNNEGLLRDSHHRRISPRPSVGNNDVGVGGALLPLTAQMLDYHERIEKRTIFSEESEDDPKLADQVTLLRKEIESVKKSLAGLQKDHKTMLNEKKELEEQYKNAKNEVTKTIESSNEMLHLHEILNAKVEKLSLNLVSNNNETTEIPEEYKNIMNNCMLQAQELNLLQAQLEKSKAEFRQLLGVKEDIESMLEKKEREYLEGIRQCEAVTTGQTGMINSMETLLMELEAKMDKLSRRLSYTNPISLFTDEELMRHQNRYGLAKEWVEDSKVSQCQQAGCSVRFNIWNRRHHCRSAYSMLLFPDGSEDWGGVWSRVCEGCFNDT